MQGLRAEELTILSGCTHGISLHAIHTILRPLLARSLTDSPPFAEPRGNGGETEGRRRGNGGKTEVEWSTVKALPITRFLTRLLLILEAEPSQVGQPEGEPARRFDRQHGVHSWFRGQDF